jgi:hypothetical protein
MEPTEPRRDGLPAEGGKATPQVGLPGEDGNGGAVAAPGVADRNALPEEGQRSAAVAVGHDAAPVCRAGCLRR